MSVAVLAAGQPTRRCGFAVVFLHVDVRHGSHHVRTPERTPYLVYWSLLAGKTCLLPVAFPRRWAEQMLRLRAMNLLTMLGRTQVRPIMQLLGWSLLPSSFAVHFTGGWRWLGALVGCLVCGMHFMFQFVNANLVWGCFRAVCRAACCISIVVRWQSAAVALYDSAANELSCAEYVRVVSCQCSASVMVTV